MTIYKNPTSFSEKDMFKSLRAWHIRNEVQAFFERNQAIVRHTIVHGNLEARMEKKHFGPQDSVYTWIFWYNESIGSPQNAPGEFSYAPFEIKIYLEYQGTSERVEPSQHHIYIGTIRLESSNWNIARELETHFGILTNLVHLSPVMVKKRFQGWMKTLLICRNAHQQVSIEFKRTLDPEFDRLWHEWTAEQQGILP